MQRRDAATIARHPGLDSAYGRPAFSLRVLATGRMRPFLAAALCLLLPLAVYYATSDYGEDLDNPVFNSPLTNSNVVLARELAEGRGIDFPLARYDELPPDIAVALAPRDAAMADGHVVPKGFLPEILVIAGMIKAGFQTAVWLPALLGALAVLGVFLIGRYIAEAGLLAGRRAPGLAVGAVAAAIFAFHPSQWIVNTRPYAVADGAALVALVFGMYLALPIFDGSSRTFRRASAVGALFAVAVGFRYPDALVVCVPLAVTLFYLRDVRAFAGMLWPSLVVGCALAPLHFLVYGSPVLTGHMLSVRSLDSAATFAGAGFIKFNTAAFARYVEYYLTTWEFVAASVAGLLVAVIGFRWGSRAFRAYVICAIGMLAVLMVVYGGQEVHGVRYFTVNTSFLRYMLPVIALLVALAVYGGFAAADDLLRRLPPLGYPAVLAGVALTAYLLASSVALTVNEYGGVLSRREIIGTLETARGEIVAATDERALIVTRLQDKVLFPQRSTLVATYLIGPDRTIVKGPNVTWTFVPEPDRFADVATRVLDGGHRLYLWNDGVVRDWDAFSARLARDGVAVRRVEAVEAVPFYEFIRVPRSNVTDPR